MVWCEIAGILLYVVKDQLFGRMVDAYDVGKMALRQDYQALMKRISTPDEAEDDKLTHHDMAEGYIRYVSEKYPPHPVSSSGLFYRYEKYHWKCYNLDSLHGPIASMYNEQQRCARHSDYQGLAKHVYGLSERKDYFKEGPDGIAFKSSFASIDTDGVITWEPHHADHRKRALLACDPEEGEMPRFTVYLERSLGENDFEGQYVLLQETMGAIFAGVMHRYQKVLLLYGYGRNGKGVLTRILRHLVPDENATAVSPFDWKRKESIAELAGKMLNLVSELPRDLPIPASEFKNVTGGDDVMGRFLYQNSFRFKPTVSHVFSSNHLIKTNDHRHGFYDRWIMVMFGGTVNESDRIPDLDQIIVDAELPQILNWALEGAQRVIRNNGFTLTDKHHRLMEQWKLQVDSVKAFLEDDDWVEVDVTNKVERSQLYRVYKNWCEEHGYRPEGKHTFFEMVTNYSHNGVEIELQKSGKYYLEGVGLAPRI